MTAQMDTERARTRSVRRQGGHMDKETAAAYPPQIARYGLA